MVIMTAPRHEPTFWIHSGLLPLFSCLFRVAVVQLTHCAYSPEQLCWFTLHYGSHGYTNQWLSVM